MSLMHRGLCHCPKGIYGPFGLSYGQQNSKGQASVIAVMVIFKDIQSKRQQNKGHHLASLEWNNNAYQIH